jgi:hypothetical protein
VLLNLFGNYNCSKYQSTFTKLHRITSHNYHLKRPI